MKCPRILYETVVCPELVQTLIERKQFFAKIVRQLLRGLERRAVEFVVIRT